MKYEIEQQLDEIIGKIAVIADYVSETKDQTQEALYGAALVLNGCMADLKAVQQIIKNS